MMATDAIKEIKINGKPSQQIKLCVAGANGRMGRAIISVAREKGFAIVGALESRGSDAVGTTLRELGICDSDVIVTDANKIEDAIAAADVFISFTTPEAEAENIPRVASAGKKIIIGTTGLSPEQKKRIHDAISKNHTSAVISPNFSIGVNVLFRLTEMLKVFPENYDVSIVEAHHTGKKDAPSGTAKKLSEIVMNARGYEKEVTGRSGVSKREKNEVEVMAIRAGGIPGIHEITVAGEYEMLRFEHTAFSRNVFAQGAVYAAEWLMNHGAPGVYSMQDVLFG